MRISLYNISMRTKRFFLLLILGLFLAAMPAGSVGAQNGDELRFPNGFSIKGEFLKFYRSAPSPALLLGDPISRELEKPGKRVQYFERGRLELVNTDKGLKVQLSNLGEMLYTDAGVLADVPTNSPTCRFFSERGHSVCYKFMQFYDENNGTVYFGQPVTEAQYREGAVVQYFEYARFEWRPNLPADLQVGLTDLGRQAMRVYEGTDAPFSSSLINNQQNKIQVRAFISQALVASSTPNTLYVVVSDPGQNYKAVAGALVNISLVDSTGKRSFKAETTNADGIAQVSLPGLDLRPKEVVQVHVSVEFGNQVEEASTWYRIWY